LPEPRATGPLADSVHFVEHDIRLPWPAQSAANDAVVENLTLEHVEDLRPIFGEAARVLQPGGWLFFCELHPFRQLRGAAAHFRNPVSGGSIEVPTYLHDVSEFLRSGLAARLRLVAADDWRDEGAMPAGDTFTVTYTTGGATFTQNGHF
jgi:malonyl-CoA O-methyltransferase